MSDDHRAECDRIIEILEKSGVWPGGQQFNAKEINFVRGLKNDKTRFVSDRMIYWLRDIKERLDWTPNERDENNDE
jgi:hypothetical protein